MVANGFCECTIGDIANLRNGKGLNPDNYRSDGRYPVWGANGQISRTNKLLNKGRVVVIGRVGANCGSVYPVFEPSWVTDNAIIAIPKKDVDFRFLYYRLKSLNLRRAAIGSAQPLVTQTGLKTLRTVVPPLSEQQAIAHFLGSLDDKIQLNRQMNETLEGIARAIFKSWFVDFDPVRAKAEGRDPGLIKEIANLLPDSFDDSELGPIPKGWLVKPLSEITNLIGGGTPKTNVPEYWNGRIPWFSVVDAPKERDVFVINTEKKVTQLGVDNSSTRILRVGTTIISARGTVGKCALVGCPMAMNQSCYGIQGKDGRGDYYTYFVIRHQVGDLQRSGHGSVFNTITRETFRSIHIKSPRIELTQAFDATVETLLSRILINLKESATLAALRDTLLPKLLSGELRILDAEKFIEEVDA